METTGSAQIVLFKIPPALIIQGRYELKMNYMMRFRIIPYQMKFTILWIAETPWPQINEGA